MFIRNKPPSGADSPATPKEWTVDAIEQSISIALTMPRGRLTYRERLIENIEDKLADHRGPRRVLAAEDILRTGIRNVAESLHSKPEEWHELIEQDGSPHPDDLFPLVALRIEQQLRTALAVGRKKPDGPARR